MPIAEELQIIIDAKVTQAVRDMKKVTQSIEGTTKTTNKLSDTFKQLAGPVAIGAVLVGLGKITKELINTASDAEETRNKFNVVFQSVADDAEAAAERIQDEFKLSESTTQNFLSQVGDITSGLGATSEQALEAAETITTLGLDIDSFANLSGGAEQAVSALTSLFTGEREAAKALGIVINDTNLKQYAEDSGKVFKALTPLEKGFLSLELATTQSELAIGDFARSSDSFANTLKATKESVKGLKVEIGEALLPVATTIVGTFGRLTGALAEFIEEAKNLEEARKATTEGVATIDQRILALNADNLELQIELNKKITGRAAIIKDGIQLSEDTKKIYQEQIDIIQNQITANNRLIGQIELRKILQGEAADAEERAEQDRLAALAKEEEARALLADRVLSRRSANEVEIALLNEQIDLWVQFREVAGVQELINDLVRERNELLEEENETISTTLEGIAEQAEAYNSLYGNINELLSLQHEYTEEVVEGHEEQKVSWEDLANTAQSTMVRAIGSITEELAKGELSFRKFAEIGVLGVSKMLEALGEELLAIAAVKTAASLFGPIGAGVALAGAAAAFAAAGLIKGTIGSYEDGGIVGGTSFTGDNVPARVNSGEMILNLQDQSNLFNMIKTGGGGGMSGPVTLIVDGQQFTAHFQRQIDNRNIRSSQGGAL